MTRITVTRNAGTHYDVPVLVRIARHAERTGPEAGDYVETSTGLHRLARVFPGGFQTTSGDSSYYLDKDGYLAHSGNLCGPMIATLTDTGRRAEADAWVFGPDRTPKTVTVSVRVWRIEPTGTPGT